MRKFLVPIIVVGVTLSFVAFHETAYSRAEKNVIIAEMQGNVEVKMVDSTSWTPANWGMRLGAGDTIKTGKASYADLSFDGMGQTALVRIDAESTMKIEQFATSKILAKRKILLDLAIGEVLVKANRLKEKSQFQVRTPTSIVGVRGTGFKVTVSAEK